jgi:MFS family permease
MIQVATQANQSSERQDTHKGSGRYAVALLTVCFTLAYVDRQVLSLLVGPLKASLRLSDSQIGLVQGAAFSIFYVIASVPLARLVDAGNRPRILACCVAGWSVMTAGCGLASSFVFLMLMRMGVAVGEAGLPPGSLAIFADFFSSKRIAKATTFFMISPYLGGGLGLFVGGLLYRKIGHWKLPIVPFVGHVEPWQMMFFLVGLPGIFMALLVAGTLPDPRSVQSSPVTGAPALSQVITFVAQRGFYLTYVGAVSLIVLLLYSYSAWMPAAMMRSHNLNEGQVGAVFGPVLLTSGIIGSLVAGWLGSKSEEAKALPYVASLLMTAAVLLVVPAVLAPIMADYRVSITLFGVSVFLYSAILSLSPVPVQLIAPPGMRAQLIAFMGLVYGLVGGLGPICVGLLSEHLPHTGQALARALAIVAGVSVPGAAILFFGVWRAITVISKTKLQEEPGAAIN